jgi:hypothetical protein
MQRRMSLLVVVAFLGASCGGTDATSNLTQPSLSSSPLSAAPLSAAVTTTSPIITAQRVNNPFCPSVAPFNVPLVVVVQPPGGVSVIVTAIRVQFVDTSGAAAPQVTLPAPVPTTQFGSALENSRSGQAFPLTVGIGCGTGQTGRMRILVDMRDSQGRTGMGQATVSVR